MKGYRLYIQDSTGHIVRADEIECEDDEAATALALGRLGDQRGELWELARRVRVFEPDREAAGPTEVPNEGLR